jgi:predicted Zn finger-like uncharacterized protein
MIIECPYCTTRFHLNERSLGSTRPTLRCSQCRRTFELPPLADPDADDDEGPDDADAVDLIYDDGLAEKDAVEPPPKSRRGRRPQEQLPLPTRRQSTAQPSLFGDDDAYSIDDPIGDPTYETDPFDDEANDDEANDDGDTDLSQPVMVRPLLVFLALVVAGYAVLAWTLRSNPDWARTVMQQVPVIGGEIDANRLGRAVFLDELRGRYERTKEGKLIFLVTGNARNDHDEPLRGIRVELQLMDENGLAVAKQSTTCGNAMRADLVRDLTEEQVAILRGWGTKPPADTNVNPGASCPIVSIFLDVPDNVAEFSGEVVQARRLS